jgi:mono/diheme cytochrome c family protein
MKRLFSLIAFLLVLVSVIGTSIVFASGSQQNSDIAEGAQLYDRWYAALGVSAPQGNMAIWSRQSTNTRSGLDTWRCSECHGWDYKGVDGAYASGSHYTGFPGLISRTADMTEEDIIAHLKGEQDPAHDFSKYIDDAALQKAALFLKEGLIDDSEYIDSISLKVINGNIAHGKQLFEETCARCHGVDGTTIIFRTEGVDEYLGDVANRDPFRFLHRTRFGVAGTEMPIGYELGWTPADGRDVLMYAQTLTRGTTTPIITGAGEGSGPSELIGGPASNIWTGILTGLGIFLGMLGGATVLFFILALVGVVVIFAIRRPK